MARTVWAFIWIALALSLSAARAETGVPVVAVLITHASPDDPIFDFLRQGLKERGLEDGRNIKIELFSARGDVSQMPALARQILSRKADVIVSPNELSTRTALEATRTIPVVMVAGAGYDPVALGLIDSYARPGGNVTGMYGLWSELETKRLELVKEILPSVRRIAILYDASHRGISLDELRNQGSRLGFQVSFFPVSSASGIEAAMRRAKRAGAGATLLTASVVFYSSRDKVAALGARFRMPLFSAFNLVTKAGVLASYGPDLADSWRRVGYYIDRILKGTPPSALPVERSSRLSLAINLKTASALGITLPLVTIQRADEVFE